MGIHAHSTLRATIAVKWDHQTHITLHRKEGVIRTHFQPVSKRSISKLNVNKTHAKVFKDLNSLLVYTYVGVNHLLGQVAAVKATVY